jgi:hypothetical protein
MQQENNSTKNSQDKENKQAGYRIHFERLRDNYSEVSAIRTHKFKCSIPKEGIREVKEKFEKLGKAVDSSEDGSLMNFLIQLYGFGFLFVSKPAKRKGLLNLLLNNENSVINYDNCELKNYIRNDEALYEFLTSQPRNVSENIKNNFLPNSMIERIGEIFERDKKINNINLKDFPIIKKVHDDLLKIVLKLDLEKKKINQKDLQEYFKINISDDKLPEATFVVQQIAEEEIIRNIENPIDIYTAYFRYLNPIAQKHKIDVQSLFGVSENQNALSKLFNSNLADFQKDLESCRNLIASGDFEYFQTNPKILNLIAQEVHKLAKKIGNANEVDFINHNFADYRGSIGGRLQSWLTNFSKRIKKFEDNLNDDGDHHQIYKKIDKFCDWKNIFPTQQKINFEKLKELRKEAYESLLQIMEQQKIDSSKRDFGEIIFEYNQYLQDFREYLMKFNNEGIPEVIYADEKEQTLKIISINEKDADKILIGNYEIAQDLFAKDSKKKSKKTSQDEESEDENNKIETDKKIIGYWSLRSIPAELDNYPRFIGQAQKNPQLEIENARDNLFKLILQSLEFAKTVREINNKKAKFNEQNWIKEEKKNNDFGLFHKNLETLKGLASCYNEKDVKKSKTYNLLRKFIDEKVDEKNADMIANFNEGKLQNVKFFLSGYEKKYKQYLKTNPQNFENYLLQFEEHFGLKNLENEEQVKRFLNIQDGNFSFDTLERGEILKIYLSLLLRDLEGDFQRKEITLPQNLKLDQFLKTSLQSLIFDKQNKLKKSEKIDSVKRFIASSLASEIRSKLGILTRNDYIKRNVIQATNGDQNFIRYVPINWGDFDRFKEPEEPLKSTGKRNRFTKRKRQKIREKAKTGFSLKAKEILVEQKIKHDQNNQNIAQEIWKIFSKKSPQDQQKLAQVLAEMPHRFEMVLISKSKIESLEDSSLKISSGLFIGKSKDKEIFDFFREAKGFNLYSFPIETSVYQKQFLERFLWGDRGDENQQNILEEKILGGTLIFERTVDIKNNFAEKDHCFYYAIPFQFEKDANEKVEKTLGKKRFRNSTINKEKPNILGIDLGEYGFGYAIFDQERQGFVAKGFMQIPLLQKMRDQAKNWKDSQASGIFSRPTTHLANIREQATGQIRNQIHHLAIKHQAIPVYEDSVDGFETGGQRISKLYKTLKISDVYSKSSNKADEGIRKHIWGNSFVGIGDQIGASYTSQTCRECGFSMSYEVRQKYNEAKKNKEKDREIDLKDQLIDIEKKQRIEMPDHIAKEKGKRGQKAWFKCQNCNHEDDADEQAAKNIALKYFFKININEEDAIKYSVNVKEKKSTNKGDGAMSKESRTRIDTLKLFIDKSKEFRENKI